MNEPTAREERERARQQALESLRKVQAAFVDIPEEEAEREVAKALAEAKAIQLAKRRAMEGSDRDDRLQRLREAFEATRDIFRDVPPEEIEREIEKAIAEVEESRRRENTGGRKKDA